MSDSCWTVEAEFRPAAVESFENSHFNQPITRDTTGGLVQIQADCQLVVKSDFAATDFLLVIHDCQFRGSGGSGPYGHPRELGSAGPIQELLQDLFSNPEQVSLNEKPTSNSDAEASSRHAHRPNWTVMEMELAENPPEFVSLPHKFLYQLSCSQGGVRPVIPLDRD